MKLDELVKAFKALGNENRLKLLDTIRAACCAAMISEPEKTTAAECCCVDEIVGRYEMAQSTVSQHLKELHNAGLLQRHKRAQWVYYTIDGARMRELGEYIARLAGGAPRTE